MDRYSIDITWSDEDEGFIATSPEFPGMSAFGETRAAAISEAETAISVLIEVMEGDGESLPQPIKKIPFSGQTRVRFPKSVHAQLAALAEHEGVSLNTLINAAVSEYVGRTKAADSALKMIREEIGLLSELSAARR